MKGLRFRSEHRYTLQGSGALELDAKEETGLLEAERGNHRIEVPVTLRTKVNALVHQAASVRITGAIDLNGKELSIAGSGALELQGDVIMNGGRVVVDGLSALRFLNPLGATLNGGLHFQPDTSLELREDNEFILMNVSNGLAGEFEEVLLPDLPDGLVWDASRLYSQGIVQIIGET